MNDVISSIPLTLNLILAIVSIVGAVVSAWVAMSNIRMASIDRVDHVVFALVKKFEKGSMNIKNTLDYYDDDLNLQSRDFQGDDLFYQFIIRRNILIDIFNCPKPPKPYDDREWFTDCEFIHHYIDCDPIPSDAEKKLGFLKQKYDASFVFKHYNLKNQFEHIRQLSSNKRVSAIHHIMLECHPDLKYLYNSYCRLQQTIESGYSSYLNRGRKKLMCTILQQSVMPHQELLFNLFKKYPPTSEYL